MLHVTDPALARVVLVDAADKFPDRGRAAQVELGLTALGCGALSYYVVQHPHLSALVRLTRGRHPDPTLYRHPL